ncbi:hypothetical protein ABIA39_005235 [Nocardia sp. GAS34]|uniref:hypothetical protein n=1 Tax=unclassified Nocardia TaxID=2637762 RepID=UPI003D230B82
MGGRTHRAGGISAIAWGPTVHPILMGGLFLAALAAAPAQAATGTVIINGNTYVDPSGCLAFGNATVPQAIADNSSASLTVYTATNCTGPTTGTVPPGGSGTYEAGSVKVG